jgi:hypothetical protein
MEALYPLTKYELTYICWIVLLDGLMKIAWVKLILECFACMLQKVQYLRTCLQTIIHSQNQIQYYQYIMHRYVIERNVGT